MRRISSTTSKRIVMATPEFKLPKGIGKLSEIDSSEVKGEKGTGFEKRGKKGPFECGNCHYFDADAEGCDQETMKEKSKQPRLADGRVSVEADDCCEYIERVG